MKQQRGKLKNKAIQKSIILGGLLLCFLLLGGIYARNAKAQVAASTDAAWIAEANSIISGMGAADSWTQHLEDEFYKKTAFTSTGGGHINWETSVRPASIIWNGKEEGDLSPNGGGTTAAQKLNAQGDPDVIPALDAGTSTYFVYSPQQLLYALRAIGAGPLTGYTISIENDLDMGGAQGYDWPNDITIMGKNTILGNNYTIYNLRTNSSGVDVTNVSYRASGLIRKATTLAATNLTFKNAHILGYYQAGALVGYFQPKSEDEANFMNLDNISVQDSLIISYKVYAGGERSNGAGAIFGRRQSDNNAYRGGSITNCNVQNCVVASQNHTGSLSSAANNLDLISNCFSVKSTVISFGEHSGGLFSCLSGVVTIKNCFVDAEVYCKSEGGVFAGSCASYHIYDCAVSGFVEGEKKLGGFVGSLTLGTTSTIVNCYSTALVGLRSEGSDMGGFVGYITNASGYNNGLVNCYAAGEVGSASTSLTVATAHPNLIGGFAGNVGGLTYATTGANSGRNSLAYCYYDKQTTAMREWNIGSRYQGYQTTLKQGNPSILLPYFSTPGDVGCVGVLTTTTTKAGAGLMDVPGTTGFQGFKDMSAFYSLSNPDTNASSVGKAALPKYYGWECTLSNHYPELKVFSEAATNGEWGKWTDLTLAYSKSSTAGVMLETWERGLEPNTGTKNGVAMGANIYDTVRDLTSMFYFTSDANEKWFRTETPTGIAGVDKAMSYIGDSSNPANLRDVIVITHDTSWHCDSFVPGVEWVETQVTEGNIVATRRFRVTPTAGIDVGAGVTIYRPSAFADNARKDAAYYDHANDVEIFFSTIERLAADMEDITTGIYPDAGETGLDYSVDHMTRDADPLTSRQLELMGGDTEANVSAYFTGNGTNDSYGGSGGSGANTGIDVSYMARDKDDLVSTGMTLNNNNANGSRLYIYVRDISQLSPSGLVGLTGTLQDMTLADMADTYNGKALQSHGDQLLLFEYVWELEDGRLIYDGKIISVKCTPFSAEIIAYEAGGVRDSVASENKEALETGNGLRDTNDMTVSFEKFQGHKTEAEVLAGMTTPTNVTRDYLYPTMTDPVTNAPLAADEIGPEYGDTMVACWKVTNDEKVISKLKLSLDSGRRDEHGDKVYFTQELLYPKAGDVLNVDYEYYRYVTSITGEYYVETEYTTRTYYVKKTGDVYYLLLNHLGTDITTPLDQEVDVVDMANNVLVELELSTTLSIEKKVSGALGDQAQEFGFTLTLKDGAEDGMKFPYYILKKDGTKITEDASHQPLMITDKTQLQFSLAHGDKIVVQNLPYGTTYTLSETNYSSDGYLTQIDGAGVRTVTDAPMTVTAKPDETGEHSAQREVEVANIKNLSPPTGVHVEILPFVLWMLLLLLGSGGILLFHTKRKTGNGK